MIIYAVSVFNMAYQQGLFQPESIKDVVNYLREKHLDPDKLIKGKDKCVLCDDSLRAYAKSLDKRLVNYLYDITGNMSKSYIFNPRTIFNDDHHKVNDFQKLHYWDFVERLKENGWWKLKQKGWGFIRGKIQVPRKLWVFRNRVILEDDDYIDISNIDPRWQIDRKDFSFDYIPLNINKIRVLN